MAKIVFYGDNPYGMGANGYFNRTLLDDMVFKHKVFCLCYNSFNLNALFDGEQQYNVFPIGDDRDTIGTKQLLDFLFGGGWEILVSNNDIWRLFRVWQNYPLLHEATGFKWIQVFPCDVEEVRQDWVNILKRVDVPIVYSKHGYNLLKEHVKNLQYWKPWVNTNIFQPEDKAKCKKEIFGSNDFFLVGSVARNQLRKDNIRTLEIFKKFSERVKEARLYLHMDPQDRYGSDLPPIIEKMGLTGRVAFKKMGYNVRQEEMAKLYNAFDVMLITTLAEGLCYPIIESQLCGTPVIAPKNTAVTELLEDGKGFLLNLSKDTLSLPVLENGVMVNDFRKRCEVGPGVEYLTDIARGRWDKSILDKAMNNAMTYGERLDFNSYIQPFVTEMETRRRFNPQRKNKILFIQHASAGDVLITTGLFESLSKKHNAKIDYMTSPEFKDIVIGNPYVDEVVDWDLNIPIHYKEVYWPHQKIRPGNWGTQDLTLYEIYATLCDAEYKEPYIELKEPDRKDLVNMLKSQPYITLNNKGGHWYRYYPLMAEVINGFNDFNFVQVGGSDDPPISQTINLAGKLSFRESAWAVKNAALHIGVDSFCSHLAGAVGTLQIVIYGSGARRVTKPRGVTIDIQPNYILSCPIIGPCWGNRPGCDAPCINSLAPDRVRQILKVITDNLGKGLTNEQMVESLTSNLESFRNDTPQSNIQP